MSQSPDIAADAAEPILAPEEIDALMKAVVPSEQTDAMFATLPPVAQPEHVEAFSFEATDQNGPDRYPLFSHLQQRMAEAFKELWAEVFQREVSIETDGIEQRVYQDILKDDEVKPQVYFVYEVPDYGRMVVACELVLVIAYIDAMLGGQGEAFDNVADTLSPVELRLARRVAASLEKLLAGMWKPVCEMEYSLYKIEVEAQFLAVAAAKEMCFSVQFEVESSEESVGLISLHFPRTFLEPVLDKLRTVDSDETKIMDAEWAKRLEKSIAQVPLLARLEFGQCHLDIQQFLALRAGDFLPLRKNEHDPATLWVSSSPMFEAMPGSQDGQLAAELLAPLSQENREI